MDYGVRNFKKQEDYILIEVTNLTKKYGKFTAIKDLNFKFEKGHVYGLLGPNGAGKSTTMNIITGCLAATEGKVTVNGFDIYDNAVEAKRFIGYLPEIPPLYVDMTPREYLTFVGKAKRIPKNSINEEIDSVIEKTGVKEVADRLIKNLSKGFKQRVGIAQAILGNPEIIILDEPTVGLDPTQLIEIRSLITELGKEHAVILSSHIMGEITAVCDYIIMIAHGKIVTEGTLEELEGSKNAATVTVESRGNAEDVKTELKKIENTSYFRVDETGHSVKSVIEACEGFDLREEIFKAFVRADAPILEMTSTSVGLEDLFIKIANMPPVDDNEDGEKKAPKDESNEKKKENTKKAYDPLGKAYLGEDENDGANENFSPLFSVEDENSSSDDAESEIENGTCDSFTDDTDTDCNGGENE